MYTLVPDDITAMGQDDETLRVTATDAAGNSTQGTLDITVDTMAPTAPDFTDVVSGTDRFINVADQDATLMGTTDADTTITLCFSGTDAACGGDSTIRTTGDVVNPVIVTGTTWMYMLVPADITAMGQDDEILLITATDAAGNPRKEPSTSPWTPWCRPSRPLMTWSQTTSSTPPTKTPP